MLPVLQITMLFDRLFSIRLKDSKIRVQGISDADNCNRFYRWEKSALVKNFIQDNPHAPFSYPTPRLVKRQLQNPGF